MSRFFSRAKINIAPRVEATQKKVSETVSWLRSIKEFLRDTFEHHRVFLTISSTLLSCGAAWLGYVSRQVHMTNLEWQLGEINRILKDELKQKINHPPPITGKPPVEQEGVSASTKIVFFTTACVASYALGRSHGKQHALQKIYSPPSLQRPSTITPPTIPAASVPASPTARWLSAFRSKSSKSPTTASTTTTATNSAVSVPSNPKLTNQSPNMTKSTLQTLLDPETDSISPSDPQSPPHPSPLQSSQSSQSPSLSASSTSFTTDHPSSSESVHEKTPDFMPLPPLEVVLHPPLGSPKDGDDVQNTQQTTTPPALTNNTTQ
eukprot:TRINITY_DN8303_c0_g1_i1.p1 TRINITY_DN8303_c0_g1~~TRINITY_DN8303_c0_g1_i1.p1  ORF type:complete len:321 (-),score=86.54 TRINITY_DN8303_c0_g1_i1:75-1037(-)